MDKAFMSQTKQIQLESWQETVWFLRCDPVGASWPRGPGSASLWEPGVHLWPPGSYKPIGLNKTNMESSWVTTVVHKSGTSAAIPFSDSHKNRFQGTESFQLYLSNCAKKTPKKPNKQKKRLGGKNHPVGLWSKYAYTDKLFCIKGSYNCQGGTATVRAK